jgi:hypothetical protein
MSAGASENQLAHLNARSTVAVGLRVSAQAYKWAPPARRQIQTLWQV